MSKKLGWIFLITTIVIGVLGYVIYENEKSSVEVLYELTSREYREFRRGSPEKLSELLESEMRMMKSDDVVKTAIEDYDLVRLLGESKNVLMKEIPRSIEVNRVEGSNLMRFKVRLGSVSKAEIVAYAVVFSYAARAEERSSLKRETKVEGFAAKRRFQEAKVEVCRERLRALCKELGIPYSGRGLRLDGAENDSVNGDNLLTDAERINFWKLRENYESSLSLLDSIKTAEFSFCIDPPSMMGGIIFHKVGWSSGVAREMRIDE